MGLTLRVISHHSNTLGPAGAKSFGQQGGTLGRAAGNDWVLPDPERIISSRHATVYYQDGQWYLTDTSTNGVYYNDASHPIGHGNQVCLNDGDHLLLGDYVVEVRIDGQDPTGPKAYPDSAVQSPFNDDAVLVTTRPNEARSGGGSLDPLDHLSMPSYGNDASDDYLGHGQSGSHPDHSSGLEDFFTPPAAAAQIPEDWDLTDYSLLGGAPKPQPSAPAAASPRPAPAPFVQPHSPPPPRPVQEFEGAPPRPTGAAPAVAPFAMPPAAAPAAPAPMPGGGAGVDAAAECLLRAAGLDNTRLAPADAELFLQTVGVVLRDMVQGMMAVLMARANLKSEFRMALTTIRPVENNPLKFSPSVDDALQNLFFRQSAGYLKPVEAVREGFDDIKCHQMAMLAGMRAAFEAMLGRFDPKVLAEDFERRSKRASLLSVTSKFKYWEMYESLYKDIRRDMEDNFQSLFGEEFVRAYENQIQQFMASRRRSNNL